MVRQQIKMASFALVLAISGAGCGPGRDLAPYAAAQPIPTASATVLATGLPSTVSPTRTATAAPNTTTATTTAVTAAPTMTTAPVTSATRTATAFSLTGAPTPSFGHVPPVFPGPAPAPVSTPIAPVVRTPLPAPTPQNIPQWALDRLPTPMSTAPAVPGLNQAGLQRLFNGPRDLYWIVAEYAAGKRSDFTPPSARHAVDGDKVRIDLVAAPSKEAAVKAAITAAGGDLVGEFKHMIHASVPILALPNFVVNPDIISIQMSNWRIELRGSSLSPQSQVLPGERRRANRGRRLASSGLSRTRREGRCN